MKNLEFSVEIFDESVINNNLEDISNQFIVWGEEVKDEVFDCIWLFFDVFVKIL